MLKHRIEISDRIFLQSDTEGHVYLMINDVLYEPRDIVPPQVYPSPVSQSPKAPQKKTDARSVVMNCVIYQYGPNHSHWPEIARSFVEGSKDQQQQSAEPEALQAPR